MYEYIEKEIAVRGLRMGHDEDGAAYVSAIPPASDVERVIRCRDCEFWERDRISVEYMARCRTGESGIRYRAGWDFCSKAIRKEKNDA